MRISRQFRSSPLGRWVYSYEEANELDKKLVELKKGDSTELEKYIEERSKLVEAIQTVR